MAKRNISKEELSKHNSPSDCWIAINGLVYDLTRFASEHPGGSAILFRYAGQDATSLFNSIHPPYIVDTLPKDACQGLSVVAGTGTTKSPLLHSSTSNGEKIQGSRGGENSKIKNSETDIIPQHLSQVINLHDFERIAEKKLPPQAWIYYRSAAEDETTFHENKNVFHRILFAPRVFIDVSKSMDCRSAILGVPCAFPFFICPTALQGLIHPEGAEVAVCRAAHQQGIIPLVPTLSSFPFEKIMSDALHLPVDDHASSSNSAQRPFFFQLYVNSDRKVTERIVKNVESAGCKGLFVTVDAPMLGRRDRDMKFKYAGNLPDEQEKLKKSTERNAGVGQALSTFIARNVTWETLKWLRSITSMPIVVKGIQRGDDSVKAVETNCIQGLMISNHGGRQLDTCRTAPEILLEVREALSQRNLLHRVELYVDGGIQRGRDIVKCLALGAKAVGIGRGVMYGLAAFGQEGVEKGLEILGAEFLNTMALLGARNVAEISRDMVVLPRESKL